LKSQIDLGKDSKRFDPTITVAGNWYLVPTLEPRIGIYIRHDGSDPVTNNIRGRFEGDLSSFYKIEEYR